MESLKKAKESIIGLVEEKVGEILTMASYIDDSNIENFFRDKAALCRAIIRSTPLNIECCPYCIDYTCDNCPYGEMHGKCLSTSSTYDKLVRAQKELVACLDEFEKIPEPKAQIVLEVTNIVGDMVTFKIASQTKRGFSPFIASNGFWVDSKFQPEFSDALNKIFFTRGSGTSHDNDELTVSTENYLGILQAVKEFNKCGGVR